MNQNRCIGLTLDSIIDYIAANVGEKAYADNADTSSFFTLLITVLQHSFLDLSCPFLELDENSKRPFPLNSFTISTVFQSNATPSQDFPTAPTISTTAFTPLTAISIPSLSMDYEEDRRINEFFPETKMQHGLLYLPVPKTISVMPFELDISSSLEQKGCTDMEPEYERPADLSAYVLFHCVSYFVFLTISFRKITYLQVSRIVHPEEVENKVVYDVYDPKVANSIQEDPK
jgi:hypothetical protein